MNEISNKNISIIIPVYNEEGNINEMYDRIIKIINNLKQSIEFIFISDGSTDHSLEILRKLHQKDQRVKIIEFSRNFGHQIAVTAGIDYAAGDAVIIIDADLQDPPELIIDFIKKWEEGYDVVYGKRIARRGENLFKKITASGFYWLIKKISHVDIPRDTGDFRLIDRKVVESLKNIKEQHRFLRGLISWVGFKQTEIKFIRQPRYAGTTHYPLKKMIKFALDGIFSFSVFPLRLAVYIGFFIAFTSFMAGIYSLMEKFIYHTTLQGWASLITAILFLGGVQLIFIGILGEYIGKIYEETKKRPLYFIQSRIGFNK